MAELEAEAFLTGIWRNFDELEENITMPELLKILGAARNVATRTHKIMVAVAGGDWPEDEKTSKFEDIEKRAAIMVAGGDPDANDVVDLRGSVAAQQGFGINEMGGLSYSAE